MPGTVAIHTRGGALVCERCLLADTPRLRLRGLLGRPEPAEQEGVLIDPAGSIHMCFMRYAIDVVFLDRDDVVVGVREGVRPWRFAAARGARRALELRCGQVRARGIDVGQRLDVGGRPA